MCLVALAWQVDPETPLVLLANRDEFFERPSAVLARWEESPEIIAGRDLRAGGTWLGFHRENRRLAVVTNVRDADAPLVHDPRSRGFLIPDYLRGNESAREFAQRLNTDSEFSYEGFNLLLFDGDEAYCVSNREGVSPLSPGVHGLSNAGLNTPWPKVERVKAALREGVEQGHSILHLEDIFRRTEREADTDLPSTGVPLDWERKLSAVLIDGDPIYGTRALSSIRVSATGEVSMREWSRSSLQDSWTLAEFVV